MATDLDNGVLGTAREGRYPAAIEADVTEERLQRFFTRDGDHYKIKNVQADTSMREAIAQPADGNKA